MRCVLAVLCCNVLLMQLMMTSSQTADNTAIGDCSQLDSCERCTSGDPSLNLTDCIWRNCVNDNNTSCISATDDIGDCAVYNETSFCPTVSGSSDDAGADDETSQPPQEFSQASFDLSSFIGGIILVLALQSGAFFAMRFLKTKDSSYETIDQTQ